jgi:hypothetical protein
MIQDQNTIGTQLVVTPVNRSSAERMLLTFFSTALTILAVSLFMNYSGLLFLTGWLFSSPGKMFALVATSTFEYVGFGLCVLAGLAVSIYREQRPQWGGWEKFDYWTTTIIRYFLANIFIGYGFAKIFHNQFNAPSSVLDTRLGDVSGYDLTWYFFGYSYAYTLFIAFSQILCSFLFFFRRTTTLGAMILLSIISNIVVVNYAFDIVAKMYADVFLAMTLLLLAQDARRIKALVWDNQPFGKPTFAVLHKSAPITVLKYVVIFLLTAQPISIMYYGHVMVMKTTTPLAGVWVVEQYKVNGQLQPESDPSAWKKLYVDSDRLVDIRSGEPRASNYTSLFNSSKQTIELKKDWTAPEVFFQGSYHLKPDGMLTLDGHDARGANIEVTLTRVKFAH